MGRCQGYNRNDEQCCNEALPGSRFCRIAAHAQKPLTRGYRFSKWLQSHPAYAVLTIIGVAAAIITLIGFCIQLSTNRKNATSGVISPSGSSPPKFLSLGGLPVVVHNRDGIVMKDGDDPVLSVHKRHVRSARCLWLWSCQSQMLVSWKLRSTKGLPVAEIVDNQWSHQPRPAILDRNYTNNILEIRDSTTGRVSLQLVDLGETVYVAGTFICSHSGWTFTVVPGLKIELRPPGAPITLPIPPVCEYPSEQHLGECSSKSIEPLVKSTDHPVEFSDALQVCKDLAGDEIKRRSTLELGD
jgi:hypothetical protein